jgi:hypothetical protein
MLTLQLTTAWFQLFVEKWAFTIVNLYFRLNLKPCSGNLKSHEIMNIE